MLLAEVAPPTSPVELVVTGVLVVSLRASSMVSCKSFWVILVVLRCRVCVPAECCCTVVGECVEIFICCTALTFQLFARLLTYYRNLPAAPLFNFCNLLGGAVGLAVAPPPSSFNPYFLFNKFIKLVRTRSTSFSKRSK
uniref:Uncharacterized protein n=1 Tax=Glossina pallidipes TaxID=7398 RepID=A0A1A9Z3J7_GLOPL